MVAGRNFHNATQHVLAGNTPGQWFMLSLWPHPSACVASAENLVAACGTPAYTSPLVLQGQRSSCMQGVHVSRGGLFREGLGSSCPSLELEMRVTVPQTQGGL